MKVIDETKSIAYYLGEINTDFIVDGTMGVGGWCRYMRLTDGTMEMIKPWFRKEVAKPHVIATFEIWEDKTIAIPKDVWDIVYPKLYKLVMNFEKETNQSISIKKVNESTQWNDY